MAHLSIIKTEQHAKALNARDRFLKSHPGLRPFQRKIDERLKKAGSDHNRLVVIHNWMMDSFFELNRQLHRLAGEQG
ncbi:MAG: DUF3135 domain-containing protein [Desulfomonile tiedjei]|nr:DUF3135 domain-containing protein [Desulfomonile tiedjei]